jgi:hypothetical protein
MRGMGSYMAASRSSFNGFYSDMQVEIAHPAAAGAGAGTATHNRRRAPRSAANLKLVKSERLGA